MIKIVYLILLAFLLSCNSSFRNSDKEKGTIENDYKNKTNDCVGKGKSPWWLLLSRYEMSEDYLKFITKDELRLIRNSIYAEKGYIFESNDLSTFFNSQTWYCPRYKNVDSLISTEERDFIDYIVELEKTASNYYNEKEIHDYFLNLFSTKTKDGDNRIIPLYFHNKYLHDEGFYRYTACYLINETDEYLAFIYNAWGGDDSEGLYYLTVLDKNLNLIESQKSEHFDIVTKDKVSIYLTKKNFNPDGNLYDEEEDKNYYLDTIGIKDYIFEKNGKLRIVESLK